MDNKGLAFAIGLAQKAGKLASGDQGVTEALKGGKARLLIIAADTADNTKKDLLYWAETKRVEVVQVLDTVELGACIGKGKRAAVAVLDEGLAKMIKNKIK